jgi:predicted O-methyltransferase YrrM
LAKTPLKFPIHDDTEAIRAVNRAMLSDGRFDLSLVPIGDGLTLGRKR